MILKIITILAYISAIVLLFIAIDVDISEAGSWLIASGCSAFIGFIIDPDFKG